jgi:hypothetical protein
MPQETWLTAFPSVAAAATLLVLILRRRISNMSSAAAVQRVSAAAALALLLWRLARSRRASMAGRFPEIVVRFFPGLRCLERFPPGLRRLEAELRRVKAERAELKQRRRAAEGEKLEVGLWHCDVKVEGCHMLKPRDLSKPLEPGEDRRRWHCKAGCNFDACANCLARACEEHEHNLEQIRTRSPEEQTAERALVFTKLDGVRASLRSNAEQLATVERSLSIRKAARHTRTLLEATLAHARNVEAALDASSDQRVAVALRELLREGCAAAQLARETLDGVTAPEAHTSRKTFLRSLSELVRPPDWSTTSWQDEWANLTAEWAHLTDQAHKKKWLVRQQNIESCRVTYAKQIEACVTTGWPDRHAAAYWLLQARIPALSRALRDRDPCYAASLHTLTEVLVGAAHRQGGVAPALYCNLRGKLSLCVNDEQWMRLEVPDHTGFRGCSSSALVRASCCAECFTSDGFAARVTKTLTGKFEGGRKTLRKTVAYEVQRGSPVVCFESAAASSATMHSAIMVSAEDGVFPPNTLFRLRSVAPSFTAPNGVHVQRTLLTVSATYLPLRAPQLESELTSKLCARTFTLSYGDRDAYVSGLDDVLARPILTLEQEWTRELEWADYAGVCYTARECWRYVTGVATCKAGCTPGVRDAGNEGKTPSHFMTEVNAFIRARRDQGHGVALSEDDAMLTLEEVLAARLYSGPAFQVINGFLRVLPGLRGAFRSELARHPALTFAATVDHLCSAVRKLAAVATPDEAALTLYRGVRGALPADFFKPDAQGLICAVEHGFMSTSRSAVTPIEYMGATPQDNVLWQLQQSSEDDAGYHNGASIEMLSQFAAEKEILFPPCVMLQVVGQPEERTDVIEDERCVVSVAKSEEEISCGGPNKRYLAVTCVPSFV